ncbi:MAG: hypothetical protein JWO53_187 [Chlamydiia bacterium]|nr:hypothetical protein [Chlamydiia bacterium]
MRFQNLTLCCTLVSMVCFSCTPKITQDKTKALTSSDSKKVTTPVVIVGGGLTGLMTAYELNKAGISSIILEEKEDIGGRIETINHQNQTTAESELEEFFATGPVTALLKELQLPLVEDTAHSSVIIDGKVYVYKGNGDRDEYLNGIFTADEKAAFLKWNQRTVALYNDLQATVAKGEPLSPELKELMTISFADYVKQGHLPRKVSEWIRITLEPDIATEWTEISALDGIDEMHIFLDTPAGFGEKNYHIAGGNSTLPDMLAQKLPPGSIRKNCHVAQVTQTKDRVTVNFMGEDQEPQSITAQYAVVTVPLSSINKIKFQPSLDAMRQKAIDTTRFGIYVKIHFCTDRDVEKTWAQYQNGRLFTLLTDSHAGSIYNASSFKEHLGPQDPLVITLLIQGKYAKDLMNMSSIQTADVLKKNVNGLFPHFSDHVTLTSAFTYPNAVAYWPLALKRSRFDDLAVQLRKPFGRVFIGGDTTDSSHADGAVKAALRMTHQLEELLKSTAK